MFKEIKSRRLALLVAIALGGGGFLSSAQNVSAADVTGRNVTIDDTQAPSNNAEHPGGGAAFGTAAGFIKDEHDNGNVKDNTLTFKNLSYTKQLYGGLTFGTGNVTGNKVFVNPATSSLHSISDGIFGGSANGGGNVEDNHATFNGDQLNGDLVGGMATDGGTGTVKKNTATLKGGNVNGSIYGGTTGNQANGDVLENEVLIEGGIVTGTGNVYGGYSDGDGNVKGNTVTIKGGTLNGIYGGYSSGTGEVSGNTVTLTGGTVRGNVYGGRAVNGNATGNTVNLGDGTSNAVGTVQGTIYGGRTTNLAKDQTTGNTLNVNANATALNIENFSTINFNLNTHMNMSNPLLTLTDSNRTKIKSLDQLHVNNATVGGGTLIENTHGIDVDNPADVGRTADKTETIIKKHTAGDKIIYRTYQFRESTAKDTDGLTTWGGRSLLGNTTTKNEITLTGNHGAQSVYGGWTSGTGSTATGENAKNHSINNKITFNGAATDTVNNMFGGLTVSPGGSATGNRAVLNSGKVTGSLTGGSVGATGGNATGNFVDINGGKVQQSTYGGSAGGTGKAENNTVTLTNGTVGGDIFGGVASSGAATGNIVNIKGGSAANHDVYGGFSTNGNATGNTVTVTGGTVQNIIGGRSQNGNATGNTVNLGDGTSDFTTGITGAISGGSGMGGGKDYLTGNTLNVYDNVQATNISNFAAINFRFNQYVTKTDSFLKLTDVGVTTIRSLNDLHLHGEHGHKGTLIEKTGAAGTIDIADGQNRLAKTEETKESVFVKSADSKKITYESYIFKGATTPTTDDGGTYKDIFGGHSILGNTTTENKITVSDAVTYRNAYGGWTSGTGSDAPADKQKNSTLNKIKVSGAANVTGKVYGGFTDVAGGNATGNEVTIEKSITGGVVGGKALGDASGNTVTVKANTGAVTGGDGATTNNNTVNLEGNVTVNGTVTGGTQANGTDNTLNVKGQNSAQSVEGFQKMNFNTNGVAAGGTMLNVTGGAQTKVNWNTLTVDGNGRDISLLKNNNGIDFGGTYTDGAVKSGLSADQKSEMNVSVTTNKQEIKYTGYQFTGVTTASVDGTNAYGGISKAGNATHHNNITVNGNYDEVYGGHTTGTSNMGVEQKNSHDNTVTITGGMLGKVYGGYTDAADGTTENNTVNLGDGTNPLAPGSTVAEIHGGNKSAKGNTLNVNTAATVGKIENFSTVAFKNASSKLTLTQAGANFDLDTIKADFAATENEDTLVENANGLTLKDNKTFRTALSTDGTKETNIEARNGNKEIVRYGYTFKGATTVTTRGTEMWGGRSAAGNSTYDNKFTVNDGSGKTVYGGYTTGANGTATDKNDSHTNKVTLAGGSYSTVYGGWTNVGKAVSNTVNVTGNATGSIVGGYSASSEASNNVVDVTNSVFTGNITGGQGSVTNYNVIRLRNATVTGMATGGTAANGVDNTLDVSYGTGTSSAVGDITNIQRLHFDMENAPVQNANPLLKLTNVSGGDKNLTGMKFAVARSGATQKLVKGDTFTLMENTTTGGHNITVGSGVTAEGRDGVSRKYEFAVHQDPNDARKLVATVTKVGFAEQAKSLVETRAGASAFLNDGADFLAGAGMNAAQKEARAAAMTGSAPYGIWAGMGAGSLRHKTGSYVDLKGWNLGVGWARENAMQAGTLTFGPFIEYGRGSYDSYLDDGTHGSGKTSFVGAGVMAKIETDSHWVDGSLRVGRTKSDYTGLATYDTTSTYYGVQVGAGKDFHVNESDTVGAYVRYAYAHTAGTSATLSSGETYDFDAVNSHRLRLGTRYTHGMTALGQFYAGLAWEYEFDGDARATSQGDSAPSPSLKGSSALLELGYRFAPQGSRMSYDLNLNGWQGKRKGVTGGASVKWAF